MAGGGGAGEGCWRGVRGCNASCTAVLCCWLDGLIRLGQVPWAAYTKVALAKQTFLNF